jgi:zinc transport system ATP-binding protein
VGHLDAAARSDAAVEGDEVLRCEKLVVGWGDTALLPPIDVTIRRGSMLAVVGRNGSGKTTWFKTVLGLLPPIRGRVVLAEPRPRLAYVPQSLEVDPTLPLSAHDVVSWGTIRDRSFLRPFASREDRRAVDRALEEAGVSDLAGRSFQDLSMGQRQRVLFARMLASEPDLALLDEPTSAMDVVAERDAIHLLARLARTRRMAVVLVSHAVDIAASHADRILLVDRVAKQVVLGPRDEVLASEAYLRHCGHAEACGDPHDA